jgi:hypothetical protein
MREPTREGPKPLSRFVVVSECQCLCVELSREALACEGLADSLDGLDERVEAVALAELDEIIHEPDRMLQPEEMPEILLRGDSHAGRFTLDPLDGFEKGSDTLGIARDLRRSGIGAKPLTLIHVLLARAIGHVRQRLHSCEAVVAECLLLRAILLARKRHVALAKERSRIERKIQACHAPRFLRIV